MNIEVYIIFFIQFLPNSNPITQQDQHTDLQQSLQQRLKARSPSAQCGCTFVIPPMTYAAQQQTLQPYYNCNCDGIANLSPAATSVVQTVAQRFQPILDRFWPQGQPTYLRQPPLQPQPSMILPAQAAAPVQPVQPVMQVQQVPMVQQYVPAPLAPAPAIARQQGMQKIPIGNNLCQCIEITVTVPTQYHCTCQVPEDGEMVFTTTYPPSAYNEPGTLPPPQNYPVPPQRDTYPALTPPSTSTSTATTTTPAPTTASTTTTSTTSTTPTTTTTTTTTTPRPTTIMASTVSYATFFPVVGNPTTTMTNNYVCYNCPQTMPCVTIVIKNGVRACACDENYRQCSKNTCCLQTYSSYNQNYKPKIEPPRRPAITLNDVSAMQKSYMNDQSVQTPRAKETPASEAVDLIMDLLKKMKPIFDEQKH